MTLPLKTSEPSSLSDLRTPWMVARNDPPRARRAIGAHVQSQPVGSGNEEMGAVLVLYVHRISAAGADRDATAVPLVELVV